VHSCKYEGKLWWPGVLLNQPLEDEQIEVKTFWGSYNGHKMYGL